MIYYHYVHDAHCPTDECCYWYRRVPATPSTCHTNTQTTTVSLTCEVEYWPLNNSDNIEVRWYRSRDEETAGINGASEIMIDDIKYDRIPLMNPRPNILLYSLGILNFNDADRGYYWCQMVVNNISLPASPYGFISSSQCTFLDITCTIDPPLCAHNISARYMAHRQMNGINTSCLLNNSILTTRSQIFTTSSFLTTNIVTITMSSLATTEFAPVTTSSLLKDFNNSILTTTSQIFTTSSFPTTDIVTITMSSFATTEVAPITTSSFPTTAVVSTIVALIIPLALTILVVSSIICITKHKSSSKFNILMINYTYICTKINYDACWIVQLGKEHLIVHHCEKFDLEEHKDANDILNPHYTEVRIATDHNRFPHVHEESTVAHDLMERADSGSSKPEHDNNLTTQQHPHSEVEEIAQINNDHNNQIKNQQSHSIHIEVDVSSEYAVVNKSKKTSKLQSSNSSATRADSAMENSQYDKLKQDRSAKDTVTSEEGNNQMDNLRDKSPSPEYAELSTTEKKIPVATKCLMEKEKDGKLDSHEYDKVVGVAQASAKVTKGDAGEVEQHYYYTLENPEECCSDSKGKEETIKTVNTDEIEYRMPQAHHIVTDDTPIAANTAAEAELVRVKEINTSTFNSHHGEASTDNKM